MSDGERHRGSDPPGDPLSELALVRARLSTWDREGRQAERRRYRAESVDRTVRARVDGHGRLLSLDVDPAVLARPQVGSAVVGAVGAARALAARERAERVRALLAGGARR